MQKSPSEAREEGIFSLHLYFSFSSISYRISLGHRVVFQRRIKKVSRWWRNWHSCILLMECCLVNVCWGQFGNFYPSPAPRNLCYGSAKCHMYKVVYCSTVCNSKRLETPSMSINRDWLYYDARIQGNNIQCKKEWRTDIKWSPRYNVKRGKKQGTEEYKLYAAPCVKDGGKEWYVYCL